VKIEVIKLKKKTILVILLIYIAISSASFYNLNKNNNYIEEPCIDKVNDEIIPSNNIGFFVSKKGFLTDDNCFDYYQGTTKIATFTTNQIIFYFKGDLFEFDNLFVEFLNESQNLELIPNNSTPILFHYFSDQYSNSSIINVKTYSSIIYKDIWENIDMIYYGSDQGICFKIVIKEKVAYNNIQMKINIDDLDLYQEVEFPFDEVLNLEKEFTISHIKNINNYNIFFERVNTNIIQFKASEPILDTFTVDALVFNTYINSNGDDGISSVAVDEDGFIYVGGYTNGMNFPLNNSFDDSYNGNDDIFIMKFTPNGLTLLYSTFIGGLNSERLLDLTLDKNNNIIGTGYITGNGLPTTAICFDSSFNGDYDAFVFKLNSTGTGMEYCSYFGTIESDIGKSISVDSKGNIFVFGETESSNLPVTINSFDSSYNGGIDLFLVKINPNNTVLEYCSYIGGSLDETGNLDMSFNEIGILYCCGSTGSSNFPTFTNSFDSTYNGGVSDGFLFQINTTNDEICYSSFFGGSYEDTSHCIKFDSENNIYLAGFTYSDDLPISIESFDTTYNYNKDIFVSKFTSNGTSLYWSTYIGGSNSDEASDIAIDDQNNVHITGLTSSENYPIKNPIFNEYYMGQYDAFITTLSSDGLEIITSTYLGGSSEDLSKSIAIDRNGFTIVGGITLSSDFPTSIEAFEENYKTGGLLGRDSFLSKFQTINPSIDLVNLLNNSDVIEDTIIELNMSYVDTVIYNWDGGLNYTIDYPYQFLIPSSPGMHVLTIYANDSSGDWFSKKFVFYLNTDIDFDNLSNIEEEIYGTDPWNNDTDSDSLLDGDEVIIYNTNPLLSDTDHDGFSDSLEIANGYDPNDPEDHPPLTRIPTTVTVAPIIGVGYKILIIVSVVLLTTVVILLSIYLFKKKE